MQPFWQNNMGEKIKQVFVTVRSISMCIIDQYDIVNHGRQKLNHVDNWMVATWTLVCKTISVSNMVVQFFFGSRFNSRGCGADVA